MNRREAKQEACRRAASVIATAMESGWPIYDGDSGERNFSEQDGDRVSTALSDLIAELERRGALAPAEAGR